MITFLCMNRRNKAPCTAVHGLRNERVCPISDGVYSFVILAMRRMIIAQKVINSLPYEMQRITQALER